MMSKAYALALLMGVGVTHAAILGEEAFCPAGSCIAKKTTDGQLVGGLTLFVECIDGAGVASAVTTSTDDTEKTSLAENGYTSTPCEGTSDEVAPPDCTGELMTVKGIIADVFCVDKSKADANWKLPISSTSLFDDPGTHKYACFYEMQVCRDSGFDLLNAQSPEDAPYRLSKSLNEKMRAFLAAVPEDYKAKAGFVIQITGVAVASDNGVHCGDEISILGFDGVEGQGLHVVTAENEADDDTDSAKNEADDDTDSAENEADDDTDSAKNEADGDTDSAENEADDDTDSTQSLATSIFSLAVAALIAASF